MPITSNVLKTFLAGGTLAVLLLSGCASVPNIEADTAAAAQIKRVAVLGIHEPANVQVANIGGAAMAKPKHVRAKPKHVRSLKKHQLAV